LSQQNLFILWDSIDLPSNVLEYEQIVFWQGYNLNGFDNAVSIAQLVEDQASSLRQRYLAWILEIGDIQIHGQRVIEHLEFRPGFSAWWMSYLVEKCNFAKSPQIDDAIKLMAFVDWMTDQRADCRLLLVSNKTALAKVLRRWCSQMGIDFEWRRSATRFSLSSWLRIFIFNLPHALQALVWLARQIPQRWQFRGIGVMEWRQSRAQITFVSYLFNLTPKAATQGVFESSYWGPLPELLQREGIETNWLHLYVKDDLFSRTAKSSAEQVRGFNQSKLGRQSHVTLDSFISVKVVVSSIRDWAHLLRKGVSMEIQDALPRLGGLDLWPFFRDDWGKSFFGVAAMSNVLSFNLFVVAFRNVEKQRLGFYLLENQGWEYGMLQAWKCNQHENIVGCAHSTVRFWDLRYFFDPRHYHLAEQDYMPKPDHVAVNGPVALEAYLEGGFPVEKLVEVEALRYLYLNQSFDTTKKVTVIESSQTNSKTIARTLRLLVLGDYLKTHTRVQMKLLSEISNELPAWITIRVKPHPACPIRSQDYPNLTFSVTALPIPELLVDSDIAYAGAVTSAALDAYCAGIPVITVLDQTALNMSPLRGQEGVIFVATPAELAKVLLEPVIPPRSEVHAKQFFHLDDDLPRWRRLIGNAQMYKTSYIYRKS
jgi:surface carbohydrate biosynthesis protein (TIGR04326 family)